MNRLLDVIVVAWLVTAIAACAVGGFGQFIGYELLGLAPSPIFALVFLIGLLMWIFALVIAFIWILVGWIYN